MSNTDKDLLKLTLDFIIAGKLQCGNPELADCFLPNIINLMPKNTEADDYRKRLLLSAIIQPHIAIHNAVWTFKICSNTVPEDWKIDWFNYLSIALIQRTNVY